MALLIHPNLPKAVTTSVAESSATLHLWDLSQNEAQEGSTVQLTSRAQFLAGNAQEFGIIYTEEGKIWERDVPIVLEIRSWDDLQIVKTFPLYFGPAFFQSMAFAPDSRWIAIASFEERLCVLERATGQALALLKGGEFISGTTFSPDSSLLAAAHTFQGGGHVSVYKIEDNHVETFYEELDRSSFASPVGDFANTFASLSFSPDGTLLVIYETKDGGPATWYGDVVLYEVATGRARWFLPLHEARPSKERFLTEVFFERNGKAILLRSPKGTIQRFAVTDGALLDAYVVGISEPIVTFALEQSQRRLWFLDLVGTPKSV